MIGRGARPSLVVGILPLLLLGGRPAQSAPRPWPLVFTQERPAPALPPGADPAAWRFSPTPRPTAEARLVRLDPDGTTVVLSAGFSWAGQPAIAHDGTKVLFAARRTPAEGRLLWELPATGGPAVAVTSGPGDHGDPEYMARNAIDVPDFAQRMRWIVYTSNAAGTIDTRLPAPARSLYARTLDHPAGTPPIVWRTTYDPGSALTPTMIRDGRVLYSSFTGHGPDPGGDPRAERFFLMAMTWEGVGTNAVRGANDGAAVQSMAAELPDRTVVYVESDGSTPDGAGRLATFAWRDPWSTRRLLTTDGARYRDPHPLPDGRLLVARAAPGDDFGLVVLEREQGRVVEVVHDDPAWDDVDGLARAPPPEPLARIPAIWPGKFTTGDFACLDVGESDLPELAGLPRGTVTAVRVLQALPRPWPAADPSAPAALPPYDPRAPFGATERLRVRVLGEVPVQPDGSFHLTVPADVPVTFQTLDRDGAVVRTMRSWIWSKPWFMRGCIGCHADPRLAPPNRVTTALRSLLKPTLSDATAQAAPDYVHHIRPLLNQRCTGGCHGTTAPEDRPRFDTWPAAPWDRTYRLLVPRQAVPGSARTSPLYLRLRGDGTRPPHAALLPGELRTIAAWIDLGAQWDATRYDIPVPPPEPGLRVGEPGPGAAAGPAGPAGAPAAPAR
ncbi:MAG: hypothetical protein RBU45_13145 [Myxococcota bacterium]|jgi:hypothetical protein|nr:hypothetical protein [Myxococcota bacterium]